MTFGNMPQRIKKNGRVISIEKKTDWWYEFESDKPDLVELYQYTDRPIAVLGSAPCLPNDITRIPECITISCNHHAFKLMDCDYMAFLDPLDTNHSDEYRKRARHPNRKHINISYCNLDETDYYCINEAQFHDKSDTGIFATWLASYLTSGDIYVCGIGLRVQSEPMHFYEDGMKSAWGGANEQIKVDRWLELKKEIYKPERVKIISPRLNKYWNDI